MGRREEALAAIEEATAIYRELAAVRPSVFRPNLATALNNKSAYLWELEQREEALAAIEEAVEIRRELTAGHPAVFTHWLAKSLSAMAIQLSKLGREAEAEAAHQEITRISQFAGKNTATEPN
jgi:tetratricopeptide (TPR) repeat protein